MRGWIELSLWREHHGLASAAYNMTEQVHITCKIDHQWLLEVQFIPAVMGHSIQYNPVSLSTTPSLLRLFIGARPQTPIVRCARLPKAGIPLLKLLSSLFGS
jgi:hypothetical protein